jgi:hypothetical protein
LTGEQYRCLFLFHYLALFNLLASLLPNTDRLCLGTIDRRDYLGRLAEESVWEYLFLITPCGFVKAHLSLVLINCPICFIFRPEWLANPDCFCRCSGKAVISLSLWSGGLHCHCSWKFWSGHGSFRHWQHILMHRTLPVYIRGACYFGRRSFDRRGFAFLLISHINSWYCLLFWTQIICSPDIWSWLYF